ncbi:hypothetical protein CYK37_00260 [Mesorhizobium loti]|nr:DUF892 family protein [Mesorhizobium loti]PLP60788.1 hypothetical protein CYK37_00260 [Mesorhizobium loti]
MTPKAESYLQRLFVSGLKEAYYAKKKIARAFPEIAGIPEAKTVSEAFKIQQQQTERHIERLERVFSQLRISAQSNICPAIDGLIEQRSWIVEDYRDTQAIDAGLLAAVRAVHHYEIALYQTLVSWARELGNMDAADLLKITLQEEQEAEATLASLAERDANTRALEIAA